MTDAVIRIVVLLGALGVLATGAGAGIGAVVVSRSDGLMVGSFIGVMATLITGFGAWVTYLALTELLPWYGRAGYRLVETSEDPEEAAWEDAPGSADPGTGDRFEGDWDSSD